MHILVWLRYMIVSTLFLKPYTLMVGTLYRLYLSEKKLYWMTG